MSAYSWPLAATAWNKPANFSVRSGLPGSSVSICTTSSSSCISSSWTSTSFDDTSFNSSFWTPFSATLFSLFSSVSELFSVDVCFFEFCELSVTRRLSGTPGVGLSFEASSGEVSFSFASSSFLSSSSLLWTSCSRCRIWSNFFRSCSRVSYPPYGNECYNKYRE